MPVLGSSEVQKTLQDVISKRSKKQPRLYAAPLSLSAAPAPRSSALLGVLFQQSTTTQPAEAPRQQQVRPSQLQDHHAPSQPAACTVGWDRTAASASVAQSASAHAPEHAMSCCPLCGVSIPSSTLQAHVDSELLKLDKAAEKTSHAAKRKHTASEAPTKHQQWSHPSEERGALQHQHVLGMKLAPHNGSLPRTAPDVLSESSILRIGSGKNMQDQPLSDAASRKRKHTEPLHSSQQVKCDDLNRGSGGVATVGTSAARSESSQQSKDARQAAHGTGNTTRYHWQQRAQSQKQPAGRKPSRSSQQGNGPRQAAHAQGKPAVPKFHWQQQERSQQQPARGNPGCRGHACMQGKRPAKVHVFGAGLSNGRKQPRQERAPGAAGARQQQGFNHFENGHGFWDGDMAGLDGLETVGLDCWEGFGTMSMGCL